MFLRQAAVIAGAFAALAMSTAISRADFPDRLIRLITPFPPGGPSEPVIRPLADELARALGQPVVVENIVGAGGTVGAGAAAAAPADGYTLLAAPSGPLVAAQVLYPDLSYDPSEAFAPVALLFTSPQLLSVHPSVPATTLAELVAHARDEAGTLNFASPGIGTLPHLLGEQLKALAGFEAMHVPYTGGGPAVAALLAGEVDFSFESATVILPQAAGGTLRLIAVADRERLAQAPEAATAAEQGLPELVGYFWTGIAAPAGTPPEVVETLNAAINAAMQSPEIARALPLIAATARLGTPSDFAAFLAEERARWIPLIEALELAER